VRIAIGTRIHNASAFLRSTCFKIILGVTCCILAMDQCSCGFQNISCGCDVFIALLDRVAASVTIRNILALPIFARNVVCRIFEDEALGASIGATVALLCTALVVVSVRAIPITAKNIRGIPSELVVGGALEHAASTLLVGTGIQILLVARCILTCDQCSCRFQDVTAWWFVIITVRNPIATGISVNICTQPPNTEEVVPVPLWNVARRTRQGATFAFLATAYVEVGIGAVHILTMYELSIRPEQVAVRALEHCAEALLITARSQILQCACLVLAWNVRSIGLLNKALWAPIVMTLGDSVTACVPITVHANPVCARDVL
jgi:hypothetical protein